MKASNILALDVGDSRVGVAIANLETRWPSPLLTIKREDGLNVFEQIAKLAEDNAVSRIIVGLPRSLEGNETAQTASARKFSEDLGQVVNLPIDLQDEAGTSIKATEELKTRGKNFEKADIDMLAACYILEDWLTSHEVKE